MRSSGSRQCSRRLQDFRSGSGLRAIHESLRLGSDHKFATANGQRTSHYPFEEIPADKSGIDWVHSNGRSPEKYLPETTGGGCAFLDYDMDGWMDIYLVNGGKCDFFSPDPPL
jgi:hypothetical protein